MKVWITKYALTLGIDEQEAELNSDISEGMITVQNGGSCPQHFHCEGKDWHRSRDVALVRAESMRVAKIASLKKSIAKLERLKFV